MVDDGNAVLSPPRVEYTQLHTILLAEAAALTGLRGAMGYLFLILQVQSPALLNRASSFSFIMFGGWNDEVNPTTTMGRRSRIYTHNGRVTSQQQV